MTNWTLSKRIFGGFSLVLALVACLAGTTYFILRTVKQEAVMMDEDVIPCLTLVARIKSDVGEIQIKVLEAVLAESADEAKKIETEVAEKRAAVLRSMDEYKRILTQEEDRRLFSELEQARDNYVASRATLFGLINARKLKEARDFNASKVNAAYAQYQAVAEQLLAFNLKDADRSSERSLSAAQRASSVSGYLSLLVVVLGSACAAMIAIGLRGVLKNISISLEGSASEVAAAASEVSKSSQSLADGASQQAASLEETGASLEEVLSMTKHNSENARKAKDVAGQTRQAAESGSAEMDAMRAAMNDITLSSNEISKIIKTIDEIAFQTNILALNAAVEAARAGEAGAGFAVVADEVRILAQRSAQSAKDTAAKIEEAIGKSERGVQISGRVAQALGDIVGKARMVDSLVAEIASASAEQHQGIGQVSTAVAQMDKVTQTNAANAEETASAAAELNAQSAAMRENIDILLALVQGASKSTPPVHAAETHTPAQIGAGEAIASVSRPRR